MRKLALIALTLAALGGCRKVGADRFHGVPDSVHVSCRSINQSNTVWACVGGGRAYTCVDGTPEHDADNTKHHVYECARTSALPTAEEPKNDE